MLATTRSSVRQERALRAGNPPNRLSRRARPHLPGDTSQGLIQLVYDGQDRPIWEIFPNGSLVGHDYALVSSLIPEVQALLPPDSGGCISVTRTRDAKLNATYSFKNRDGQTIEVLDAQNRATTYSYGAFGALQQITGPNGALTYEVDDYGRTLSSYDAAVGGQTGAAYNGLDELVAMTDPAGRSSTIVYDELGRQNTGCPNPASAIGKPHPNRHAPMSCRSLRRYSACALKTYSAPLALLLSDAQDPLENYNAPLSKRPCCPDAIKSSSWSS